MSTARPITDLAPNNPYGLQIAAPLLPAPGCAVRDMDLAPFGALLTRTATAHTRRGPAMLSAAVPAGVIVSDIPTVSLRTLLKEDGRRWVRSTLPVIVSLQGDAAELAEMAEVLEGSESVAGVFLQPEGAPEAAVAAVRATTPRPILALLPYQPDLGLMAQAVVAAGADALVVAAPPTGAIGIDPVLEGPVLGPAAFPFALQALRSLRDVVDVPCVMLGGITTPEFAQAAFAAGASAVMIDAPRWGDLLAAARIARSLA